MIKTNTVFVLGAGASVPFGFPTGIGLREMICTQGLQNSNLYGLLGMCGQSPKDIKDFRNEFEWSGLDSVDAFIARRPEYQNIGELAIAAALVPMESTTRLFWVDNKRGSSGWYQMLWNAMVDGVAEPKALLENQVRFITFNYDRSLEQYFLTTIQSAFGLDMHSAHALLVKMPLRHVYGSLGDYTEENGFSYGGHGERGHDALVGAVLAAQKSIKTVPAVRPDIDQIAADWLASAQRVFIMGFGFDPTNCARINLPNACSEVRNRGESVDICASAFNLTHEEKGWCNVNARGPYNGGLNWATGDCLALLRERRSYLH